MTFQVKIINNSKKTFFLSLIGVILIITFIWVRFIKERLPRNIPFQLSIISFLLLVLCVIFYIYILYKTFIPSSSQNILLQIIKSLLKPFIEPLITINDKLLQNTWAKYMISYLSRGMLKLLVFRKTASDALFIYSFIFILPKTIFGLCFLLDCFYNKQLYLIYWCTFVLSLPLGVNYLLYSAQRLHHITELEKYFLVEITSKDIVYSEDDFDDKGFLKNHLPVRFWNLNDMEFDIAPMTTHYNYVTLSKFIMYQSTELTLFYLPHEYIILYIDEREDIVFLSNKPTRQSSLSKRDCENILNFRIKLILLQESFDFARKYYFKNKININKLTLFANICNGMILLCWMYILIKSFHTLPDDAFFWLEYLIPAYENPFS